MKKSRKIIAITIIWALCANYTSANNSLEWFRSRIDSMPIEKRISFYEKAIPLLQKITNNPAATSILSIMINKYDWLQSQKSINELQDIPNVDYNIVRQTWIEKHNTLRSQKWLSLLTNNDKLNKSAQIRANYLAQNMIANGDTHKRWTSSTYYDYEEIWDRFIEQNVIFVDTWTTAFSESVGYGYYKWCNNSDCSDVLLKNIESTRQFFAGEAKYNGPHYRALVGANFTQIGIGIARNQAQKRYYVVVHYGTEIQ